MTRGLAPTRTRLHNGATVTVKESRVTPAVVIHATIAAGSIFDPAGHDGIAHFVSRTIDRGTTSLSADVIADELDRRAVSLNITVNRHVAALTCTCLEEDLDDVLTIVADVLANPVFPATDVETRRSEIVTLIRQDEDSPAAMANEGLMALLYGAEHPYGRRPRGSLETVASISREDLSAFHSRHYRPAALSLVLVGQLEPQRATAAAARALAGWVPAPVPPPVFPPIADAAVRQRRVIPMMNKAQTDIAYGFRSIRRDDPAYYANWLMNNILGQYSLGGRLGDSIRERQGMAYYVFSALDANVIPGPLTIRAGVSPANVERAVESIDAEVSRLAAEGPTARELEESRRYLIGSMPRNLETNLGIAQFLQTAEFFNLGLDYDLRMPALLEAVTLDDVHAAARAALDPSRAAVVVAGPFAGTLP